MDKEILTQQYINSYIINKGKIAFIIITTVVAYICVIAFVVAVASAVFTKCS